MNPLAIQTIAFQPGERNIFLHLLTACNLSCGHCYINRDQHGSEALDLTTIRQWLRLFFDPDQQNNLVLLGGEPTLHPDLAEVVHHADSLGYHSITIDSNGYLFHHILDKITPDQAVISFSLDGPDASVNDPLRGKGAFAACTTGIRRAIAKGFTTSVIYTVSQKNIAHLHRMPALLRQMGVRSFFIQVIGLRGKSAVATDTLQLTPAEWLATVPAVAREAAELGLNCIYPKVFLDPGEPFECAGQVAENFFIFPNGRVYQCPLCEDYPIHAYRIEDGKLLANEGLTEQRFFTLTIPEGCVMNKLLQPDNIHYDQQGNPHHRISCCLLKNRITGAHR